MANERPPELETLASNFSLQFEPRDSTLQEYLIVV